MRNDGRERGPQRPGPPRSSRGSAGESPRGSGEAGPAPISPLHRSGALSSAPPRHLPLAASAAAAQSVSQWATAQPRPAGARLRMGGGCGGGRPGGGAWGRAWAGPWAVALPERLLAGTAPTPQGVLRGEGAGRSRRGAAPPVGPGCAPATAMAEGAREEVRFPPLVFLFTAPEGRCFPLAKNVPLGRAKGADGLRAGADTRRHGPRGAGPPPARQARRSPPPPAQTREGAPAPNHPHPPAGLRQPRPAVSGLLTCTRARRSQQALPAAPMPPGGCGRPAERGGAAGGRRLPGSRPPFRHRLADAHRSPRQLASTPP